MLYRNKVAAVSLMCNSFCDAFHVLLIGVFVGGALDLDLAVGMMFGVGAGLTIFVLIYDHKLLLNTQLWIPPWKYFANRYFMLNLISLLGWPIFIAASALIGAVTVTIIFGLHTIIFIPLLNKISTNDSNKRWEEVGSQRSMWIAVAFIGMVLAVLAQGHGDIVNWDNVLRTLSGVILALLTTICAALSAARFKVGTTIAQHIPRPKRSHNSDLSSILMAHIVGAPIVTLTLMSIGGIPDYDLFWKGCCIGILGFMPGVLTKTIGCLWCTNLSLNAISYGTPLVTLVLFAIAGQLQNVNIGLVTLGAICVVGANFALFVSLNHNINVDSDPHQKST